MTVYTLETHIRYLQEVGAGVEVQVDSRVLGVDAKRLRLFHRMKRANDTTTLATAEKLLVNIDTSGPRSAPWAAPVRERLDRLHELHAHQALPDGAGRSISLERHSLSKRAKDFGSAAVLLALVLCGGTWLAIAGPHVARGVRALAG